MARSRNIKPGFFKNEFLAEIPFESRLLFIGLWTLADREGRLEDRPKRIKVEVFPFDDCDVDLMLTQLQANGFLRRYEVDGQKIISIHNFVKHQDPHYKEKASELPPAPGLKNEVLATNVTRTQRTRVMDRDGNACQKCAATSHLCIDHVIPVSLGGTSDDDNLQVLCMSCNSKKSNSLAGRPASKPQRRVNDGSTVSQFDPSSLIPDSLQSDSLQTTTAASPPRAEFSQAFETAWAEYPKRNGDNPKRQAAKAWSARIVAGRTPAEMIDGVRRYAAWCRDTGKAGSETVMQAKRFFGPDEPFKNTWSAAPEKPKVIIPDCRISGCKREGIQSLGGVCEVHYAQSKPAPSGDAKALGSFIPKRVAA